MVGSVDVQQSLTIETGEKFEMKHAWTGVINIDRDNLLDIHMHNLYGDLKMAKTN